MTLKKKKYFNLFIFLLNYFIVFITLFLLLKIKIMLIILLNSLLLILILEISTKFKICNFLLINTEITENIFFIAIISIIYKRVITFYLKLYLDIVKYKNFSYFNKFKNNKFLLFLLLLILFVLLTLEINLLLIYYLICLKQMEFYSENYEKEFILKFRTYYYNIINLISHNNILFISKNGSLNYYEY